MVRSLSITLCLFLQGGVSFRTGVCVFFAVGSQQSPVAPPHIRTGNTGAHRAPGCDVSARTSQLVLKPLNHSATSPVPKSSIYQTQIRVRLTEGYLLYYLWISAYYLAIYIEFCWKTRFRNFSQSSTFYPNIDMNNYYVYKVTNWNSS